MLITHYFYGYQYSTMRTSLWLFIALLATQVATAQTGTKQITLEDLWKNNTFKVKDVPGFNAMKDGIHYTQVDRDGKHMYIRVYNLETGKQERTLFDNAVNKQDTNRLNIESYTFSKDEQKMLLFADGQNIYRRSVLHYVYVYDIAAGTVSKLDTGLVLHATFSPDEKKIAFVKNNNLYYKDLQNSKVVTVTTDGVKNKIINGNCDWVYEEEFSFTRAFDWSADGRYLAYYRFDESGVPEYTLAKYTGLYPEQYTYKYPKAGERNSVVQVKIYDVQNKKTIKADVGTETDQYIPRIKWTNSASQLCVYRLNRLQNKLELLLANAATGATKVIYKEENKCYVGIDDEITFLPDGHSMIMRSERNGYNHLYNCNWQSNHMTDLTEGNFDVDVLTGIDKERQLVYYTSTEASPLERKLYVVGWNGGKKKCLTPKMGMHNITPCEGYNFFIDRHTCIDKVPVYNLINAKGQIIRTLEDNKALEAKMKEYDLGDIHFTKIKGVTDTLYGWIIRPPGFDNTKKYPVLMFQYSGPGSQQVNDNFPAGNFFWHQMLAQKGYIVLCVDGTGTGFRGEEFRKKTYLQLGKYESDDQIAVAKELGKLAYVDKDRIGIWGWSYGGFMSATCIMKGNDVFKAAIAVAPVTNWRFYDNIYTERYMRTPKENQKGYDENAPEKMATGLKGKFLVIHGTADDNVHFQNAVMLNTALINANKEFESEYYPDKAHGISGGNTRYHLYNRMTDFILKNL
ncbi:MAG: family peptidase [Flavipsychrobacter sp.]|nr:family peptidase [Flavipsychrobacter sp.]